jgi:hypothetical protein
VEDLPDVIERRVNGELKDLQTPLEWADNNHPLWETERTVWRGKIYTLFYSSFLKKINTVR